MTSLTRLRVHLWTTGACVDALSLPVLRFLHVEGTWNPPRVQHLLHKCAHIRKFVFSSITADCTQGQLPRVLAHLTNLASLELAGLRMTRGDFIPLSSPDPATGTWIAPELEKIIIKPTSMDRDAASSCIDFVRSRTAEDAGPTGGRKRLRVARVRMRPAGDLDWLQSVLSSMCEGEGQETAEDTS
ncbi:hypothetical protein AURDEDRAFT_174002 [Auricularia subglabra TFB-10046 SS5]|uniref:F-box domain-containing protein n=1 Tax=Auricularia subglabra (strain TFB-10046 / SS5) TaxID=717982 RepID=J0CZ81_AURST|nr:hypothetical protein AURDEDRAFT_174002 [Auricularia subglabra TFB-10046 SS5]